ncbi:MAG TPA: penicillin acylase family protein [Gemmatimonadaceae bacterium]|nr:penicillin acylase family protein [Gemmatimonadaceae bacterium]
MSRSRFLCAAALCAAAACAPGVSPPAPASEIARLRQRAQSVTITRDDWGIAHVRGHTDADAVFGMIYAQAEDDFNRVETNYINAMGRLAEAEGESAIYQDLRMKLFIDPDTLKAQYATSPAWLQQLMNAWADGLNYYLATHPAVKPRVITRFEPWMALSFSEGSIGGDIESISIARLAAFYGKHVVGSRGSPGSELALAARIGERDRTVFVEPTGSNGFAIAPSNTVNHHALLLINPHTSFFFRSELQMSSDEGLDAYGAATWGQFFIYQGFNRRAGWMHTSSGVDVIDEFAESIVERGGRFFYRYGGEQRPVTTSTITIPYRTAAGTMAKKSFVVFRTHHGPIVRESEGKWISVALMNTPVAALEQSYLRTRATDYASFIKVAGLRANSSNNTIFADADGNIAYLHPQFIPRRDDRFDYTRPVDGSDPATDWRGLTPLDSAPHLLNPPNGWIFNTNDWPYSAAGPYSPKRADFPRYMDTAGENPRGIHARMVLEGRHDFTLASLQAAAYDSYLTAFAQLIPTLVAAYDSTPTSNPLKSQLAGQVAMLRAWDYRWSATSVPTALAVFWGERLWGEARAEERDEVMSTYDYMATKMSAQQKLQALADASARLEQDFGTWRTPWGEINRFQRLTGDLVQPFSDAKPSIPVPFTSSQWGSLASFGARRYPGTKKYYGTSGNSFVAVVEFGDSVRARAVTAGGESGHPDSPHFNDEALRYSTGDLREVYFHPSQLAGHTERTYHPGS